MEWIRRFPGYTPELVHVNASESREKRLESTFLGHCKGTSYIPLRYPNSGNASLIEQY